MSFISRCPLCCRILIKAPFCMYYTVFTQLRKIDRNFKNTLVFLEELYYNMKHIKQAF